jgi:uncharacterized PurR-regulated membrane protein YhhQ (DUF165 family)
MRYGALLGWGIVVYAVMFLAVSIFAVYGLAGSLTARLLGLFVLIVVSTIAGRSLHFKSSLDILPYSIGWMVVVALLDASFAFPFRAWTIYMDWNLWLGYGLVVLIPLLTPYERVPGESPRIP